MKNASNLYRRPEDIGTDTVIDAINAGFVTEKFARAQQKQMITGIERAMRISGKGRSSNPIAPDKADILPWNLYDQLTTAAAVATLVEYDFFTTPIGGAKTKVQTNMEQVSQLPAPQHFNCTSLSIYFATNMLKADVDSTLNAYYLEFWIGNKVYAEGPLQLFPAGAGMSGYTTRSNTEFVQNGAVNCMAVVDFRMGDNPIGHHILQGQNFKVKVIGNTFTSVAAGSPTFGTGLNFSCYLQGILSRGVQ
jgi:hypothetical protein